MVQPPPTKMPGPGGLPLGTDLRKWRVEADDRLESSANYLSKRNLPLSCDPLRLTVKMIGDLNLGFDHDGNLPSFHAAKQDLAEG